jgi:hypothetical protein
LPHARRGPADRPGAQAFVDLDHAGAAGMIDRGHAAKADQFVGIGQGALRGSHAPHQPRPDRARHGAGLWPRASQRARVAQGRGRGDSGAMVSSTSAIDLSRLARPRWSSNCPMRISGRRGSRGCWKRCPPLMRRWPVIRRSRCWRSLPTARC